MAAMDDSNPDDDARRSGSSESGPPAEEHDPTIIFEPPVRAPASGASGSRVEGAFAWALIVETGPQAGLTYVLGPGATVLGRGADSDIFLEDVTVSRHHARVTVDDSGLLIEDLGSTNGTYVNGRWADASALVAGDEIFIGKFHLVVARGND
jgi:pSer/pThr/pTyr-binding forkhead associated (FHA) protein